MFLVPLLLMILAPALGVAHGVEEGDAAFIQGQAGFQFWPYFYLGAKHMVTGFDHLAFLAGVIFFSISLRRSAFTSRYLRSVTA